MQRQPGYAPKNELPDSLPDTPDSSPDTPDSSPDTPDFPPEIPDSSPEASAEQRAQARQPGYASPDVEIKAEPDAEQASVHSSNSAASEAESLQAEALQAETRPGLLKGILLFVGTVLVLVVLNQWIALWQQHWVWGVLATAAVIFSGIMIYRIWQHELKARDRVDQLKSQQQAVREALEKKDLDALKKALKPWISLQERAMPAQLESFRKAAAERKTAEEYWSLYQILVLDVLDQKAQKLIHHYVMTTSAAVMVVPHPALDSLVLLWRSRSMVSALAKVYGVETTTLSSLRLFKQALVTVGVVAGLEGLTQEQLLQEGSHEIQSRILSAGSQGVIAFWRTYKLGRLIKVACRPF